MESVQGRVTGDDEADAVSCALALCENNDRLMLTFSSPDNGPKKRGLFPTFDEEAEDGEIEVTCPTVCHPCMALLRQAAPVAALPADQGASFMESGACNNHGLVNTRVL